MSAKRSMYAAAAAAAAILLTQSGPVGANRPGGDLDRRVADLETRVERLEGLAAMDRPSRAGQLVPSDVAEGGGAAPSASAGLPKRVMHLDGVETAEPDPGAGDELESLRDEIESLQRTVDNSQQRVASQQGNTGGYRSSSYTDPGPAREARAEAELLAQYRAQLRQKQGELKRLERESQEPSQIINGNWDGKLITLRTTKDLSRALDRIESGDLLTWEGRRVSEDSVSQEWVVTSVRKVEAPQGP